jgi:hypothetical protein
MVCDEPHLGYDDAAHHGGEPHEGVGEVAVTQTDSLETLLEFGDPINLLLQPLWRVEFATLPDRAG